MKKIAISQRVTNIVEYNEQRDCLDQQWISFLCNCGMLPIIIPNHPEVAKEMLEHIIVDGFLLTGGNDLLSYGGDSLQRDKTEIFMLEYAIKKKLPLLGVCRGMQLIQSYYGVKLERTPNQISHIQAIDVSGKIVHVNSFHNWGSKENVPELKVWARSNDGVIKAIKHIILPLMGIMWHPERFFPFREEDLRLVKNFFIGDGNESNNTSCW